MTTPTQETLGGSVPITAREYQEVRARLYHLAGIALQEGKEGLVQSRLGKRMRALSLSTITDYLARVDADKSGAELTTMIDALTTNKTSWFREMPHFEHLAHDLIPSWRARRKGATIWSAASSSGEEPYSIALLLREEWPESARAARILATDLSTVVLKRARTAVYDGAALDEVPPSMRRTGFVRASDDKETNRWQVVDEVRAMVRFARLNLMGDWPMSGPFDLIVCRNVMIYFDKGTQQRLIDRFSELLMPGGTLYIGHSESLAGITHRLRYVQPAVYEK